MEVTAPGGAPRAFLRVGGLTVARQQLAVALALKCERILCLGQALTPELVELQHAAEQAGARFHLVGGPRALLGLVTATDEIFALGDGLFASTPEATRLLDAGQVVLVQPIEQGLDAGFERIDINHAAAAAMRIPGRLVERIAELPSDCDAISALQRIALQAGVAQRPIPPLGQGGLFWTLLRSEDEAHALEPQWVRQRTRGDDVFTPTRGLALLAVRSFGPALLHAGSGAGAAALAAGATALIALGAGWFGFVVPALLLCALGWALREATALISRIQGDVPTLLQRQLGSRTAYGWLLDAVIITLAAWSSAMAGAPTLLDRLFPPLMLVALLRLLPAAVRHEWTTWAEDRALLALLLAAGILAGVGSATIHLAAVAVALAAIVLSRGAIRLTRP